MRTLLVSLAVALAAPALAAASPSVVFSQSAEAAWASPAKDDRATLALRTGHAPVLALEERPGRRVGTIAERNVGLWRGTFRADPPNAVLTGVDQLGRKRRAVVVIERASRTRRGVRYGVRVLRGRLPRAMRTAELMVDGVPWQSVANRVSFPTRLAFAAEDFTVTAAQPLTFTAPAVIQAGTITLLPGASLVMRGTGSAEILGGISGEGAGDCGDLRPLNGLDLVQSADGRCRLVWRALPATLTNRGSVPVAISGARVSLG